MNGFIYLHDMFFKMNTEKKFTKSVKILIFNQFVIKCIFVKNIFDISDISEKAFFYDLSRS